MDFQIWIAGILAVVTCLLATICIYLKYHFTYWKRQGIPYLEPKFPFGNSKDIILMKKSIGEVAVDWYKQSENLKVVGIYQIINPTLVIRDPELIKTILIKEFSHFHDRGIFLDEENDPISAHLFILSGQRWKNMRNKLSPTFTSGKLKMMFPTMLECGCELKDYMEGPAERKEVLEVKDIMARYTTDIIASTAFGITCNCLKEPDAEFRVFGRKVFEPTVKKAINQMTLFLLPRLASLLKITHVEKSVANFFRSVVKTTIEYREKNNVERKDFMQLLIHLKNHGVVDGGKTNGSPADDHEITEGLTLDQVAAQAFVFYIAGFETSSTTLSFCLYELAVNPDVQTQLRQEIHSVTEEYYGEVTYESILKMDYLDKVISETLRKYPPLPFVGRVCTKDLPLPGFDYVIPKGMDIIIPNFATQMDPKYFPNPEVFNPENFSEEAKSRRPSYVYLPFGDGPRNCIGMRFGQMQVKVGLVKLLSHYKFHVSDKTPVPIVFDRKSFILSPVDGMWLKVTKVNT